MQLTSPSKTTLRRGAGATFALVALALAALPLTARTARAQAPRLDKTPAIADDARGFAVRIPIGATATPAPQGWLVAPVGDTGVAVIWQDAKDERALRALLGASTGGELGQLSRQPGEPVWRAEVVVPGQQPATVVATMDPRAGTLLFFAPATEVGRATALAMARAVLWGRPSSTYETTLGRAHATFRVDPRWSLQRQSDGALAFRSTDPPGVLILGLQLAAQEPPVMEADPMPGARWEKSGGIWSKRGVFGGQPAMLLARIDAGVTVAVVVSPPDPGAARAILQEARIDAPRESARTAALRERLTGSAVNYHFSASTSERYELCADGRFSSTSAHNSVASAGPPGQRIFVHSIGKGADAGTWSIDEDADGVPTLTLAGDGGTATFTPESFEDEDDIRTKARIYAARPGEKRPVAHLEILGRAGGCP